MALHSSVGAVIPTGADADVQIMFIGTEVCRFPYSLHNLMSGLSTMIPQVHSSKINIPSVECCSTTPEATRIQSYFINAKKWISSKQSIKVDF